MCFVIAQMVSFHGNIEKSFLSILLMNSFVKSMKNRKKEKLVKLPQGKSGEHI